VCNKGHTATKTEVNICNIQVRSICQIMSCHVFNNNCIILVCSKNEFTPTHRHTNLWTVQYKDLISSVLPFHITVMGNNLVVLQTKFGTFQRSKQIYSINPECEII